MSIKYKFAFLILVIFASSFSAIAQNRFEGYNIFMSVPENHKQATCAIRFVPPTRSITIADLNPATPMNVKSCDGSGSRLTQNSSSTASMTANSGTKKWCFEGEDEMYRISFRGDRYQPRVIYNWISTPKKDDGFINIKDFGAMGDGRADDTIAIRGALAYLASQNGGTLVFPNGEYVVSSPIALPSGVVIKGTNGLHSGASTNGFFKKSSSRIVLRGANKALFRIGECTEKVSFQDIELYAETNQNTYGVEGVGAYTTAQGFSFDRVVFNNFYRGIYVHGLPQTNLQWQFDYVKIKETRFIFNKDAGLWVNTKNSDWKVEGSLFVTPKRTANQRANAMHFERVGMVTIQDTFAGGFNHALGGTFINVFDSGNLTIIGSQSESMHNSLVYNEVNNPGAGDLSYPITVVNSTLGHSIVLKARRTFVSTGSVYSAKTFTADERVRIYSTGDRFCYDGYILGCQGATKKNFDGAKIIFMTGQPSEGKVTGHPTVFGTDVEFNNPVRMPSFRRNLLPGGKGNGSMVYCSDCRRDTDPCRGGGNGAPAMVVGGRWSCL